MIRLWRPRATDAASTDELAARLSSGVSELERETLLLRLQMDELRATQQVPTVVGRQE